HPGAGDVCDGRRLRDADTEDRTRGAGVPGTDADENPDGACAHEVEGGLVRGAATDDDGDVERADEPLQVQGLGGLGDVLGGYDGALDDQDVELTGEDRVGQLGCALRRDRGCRYDPLSLYLLDPLGHEV